MPVHRKTNPDRIICNSYFQLRQNYTTGKKYRLLAFFYITKIVTLKSLFVKMVWCHFDSVAGQHGHKSLMQDLTWLTYQSTHHSLTSEATLFHQFPAKERRSFNPLTSKSDEHLISLKSFTTKSRLSIQFSPIPASPDNRGSTVQVKYWVQSPDFERTLPLLEILKSWKMTQPL